MQDTSLSVQDPEILRVLQNMQDTRNQRDNLLHSLEELTNKLALAEARIKTLESENSRLSDQRDHYMRRTVEMGTHFELIHSAALRAKAAIGSMNNGSPTIDAKLPEAPQLSPPQEPSS